MRRAAAALAASVVLAGCGGSGGSASDARQVRDAYARTVAVPERSASAVSYRFDTRGLDPGAARVFAGGTTNVASQSLAESAGRVESVITSAGGARNTRTVLYDGSVYVAPPGQPFRLVVPPLVAAYRGLAPESRQAYENAIAAVSDRGTRTIGGARLRQLHGQLSDPGVNAATARFLGTFGARDGSFALDESSVDVYIDPASGRIVRERGTLRGRLDLSGLDAAALGRSSLAGLHGTVRVTIRYEATAEALAGRLAIKRPAFRGTVATAADLLRRP